MHSTTTHLDRIMELACIFHRGPGTGTPRRANAEKSKDDFENFENFEGRCFICFALFGLIDDGKTTSRCIQPLHTSTALWNLHAPFTVAQVR